MYETYAEAGVKCITTPKTIMKKVGYIAAILVSFFVLPMIHQFLIAVSAGIITVVVWMFPRLNYEYEYVFCDGQLDFDKIMGRIKRKRMLRVDFEHLEVAAPEGSHELDQWKNAKLIEKDFTSYRKDITPYVLIIHKGNELLKIKFEPSKKMIDCMKNKAPRKVITS